jgi:hypothetical protein
MARQKVALYHLHENGPRVGEYLELIGKALPGGSRIDGPDDLGFVEVELDANDQEDALQRVWDAIAAAGADDHLVIAEHPDLPEHWRTRAGGPGTPAP